MSQDMMHSLAGSSLLSLSVGTLPAVKSGMMLDANPFASQLALMTAPVAADSAAVEAGIVVAGGADIPFATALAQATAPTTPPATASVAIAVPVTAESADFADIPALPDDASPSQIIEAVLGTAPKAGEDATPIQQPITGRIAAQAATPDEAEVLTTMPVAPARPAQAPEAGENTALRPLTPQALPDTVAEEGIAPEAHTGRTRRTLKAEEPVASASETLPVAMPIVAPETPAPVQPAPQAPEDGSVRIAISTRPAPLVDSARPDTKTQGDSARAEIQPDMPFPAAPRAATPVPGGSVEGDTQAKAPASPVAPSAPSPAAEPVAAVQQSASRAPMASPATPPPAAAAPTPDVRAPVTAVRMAAPHTVATQVASGEPVAVDAVSAAPATPDVQLADAASAITVSTTHTAPAAAPVTAGSSAPAAQAAPVQATEPVTPPVAATDPAVAAPAIQTVQTPVQRPAAPTSRAAAPVAAQRVVQAASQLARPAAALSALFDLADPAASPVSAIAGQEAFTAVQAEIVPPSWAAALNAVISPAATNAAFGLTAATGPANAQAAQLETLAFDAGFVGNVETQIARVAGGGQMVWMQIMPEHLGRIDIEMLAGPERDQVRIVTEHDAVRDTLVQSQVRLEQDLRNNGQRNTDVTVELRQQSTGAQGGSAQQQRGQSGQEANAAREALQRQSGTETTTDTKTAQRRPRGNVRYA